MLSSNNTTKSKSVFTGQIKSFHKDPRQSFFIITVIVAFVALLHLAPHHIQITIANIFRHTWVLALALAGIMIISYFNWIIALLLLFLLICVLYPIYTTPSISSVTQSHEGFTGTTKSDDISINNSAIQGLFTPGVIGKTINESRKFQKEKFSEVAANNKHIELISMAKHKTGKALGKSRRTKEDFKEITLRKFDPTNEEDMNLLLTMDNCEDIINRIKYVYEDKKYLKKYISEKIEEMVDMLDLATDES